MRLLRREEAHLVFGLTPAEERLLDQLLRHYPLLPAGHHRRRSYPPSGNPAPAAPADALDLLEETLEEHRSIARREVQAWLADPKRLRRSGPQFELCLAGAEFELLLQVLNDIRVGSWVALGEPGERLGEDIDPVRAPQAWSMELAGYFESCLLEGLQEGGVGA